MLSLASARRDRLRTTRGARQMEDDLGVHLGETVFQVHLRSQVESMANNAVETAEAAPRWSRDGRQRVPDGLLRDRHRSDASQRNRRLR